MKSITVFALLVIFIVVLATARRSGGGGGGGGSSSRSSGSSSRSSSPRSSPSSSSNRSPRSYGSSSVSRSAPRPAPRPAARTTPRTYGSSTVQRTNRAPVQQRGVTSSQKTSRVRPNTPGVNVSQKTNRATVTGINRNGKGNRYVPPPRTAPLPRLVARTPQGKVIPMPVPRPKTGPAAAKPVAPKVIPMPVPRPKTGPAAAQQPGQLKPVGKSGYQIDHSFIKKQEAMKYEMYVPTRKDGTVLDNSGPTIANGLDLGQRKHMDDLKRNGLSPDLAGKLQPYLGMTKADAAQYVKDHPLALTKAEGDHLASVVSKTYDQAMANSFNKVTGGNFASLPANVQTALASVGHQYGNFNRNEGIRAAADAAARGDYAAAAQALQGMDAKYQTRRNEEAALMRA